MTDPLVYGWAHIGTMGRWEPIARDLFSRIEQSGLREATSRVFVGVFGPDADLSWFPPWAHVVKRGGPQGLGECPTLQALWEWSKAADGPGKVWYVHTKGSSHTQDEGAVASLASIDAWTDMMTYFVIDRWRECVAALEEYDICGCDWVPNNTEWFIDVLKHVKGSGPWCKVGSAFLGGFWWSTLDHLRNLPPDEVILDQNRWCAEWHFVGAGNPRALELHGPHMNLYANYYPRSRYEGAAIVR